MVEHVRRRAGLVDVIDRVVVATCDAEIAEAVRATGGEAVMTSDAHERCTERVEEAMRYVAGDVVVIVQGDEPLLSPGSIRAAVEPVLGGLTTCTNVLNPMRAGDATDPNVVKAVCDQRGDLMFLTRAPVPHRMHAVDCPVYRQTGLMAMTIDVLRTFVTLPATPFERAESIDILRLLEHGHRVRGVPREDRSVGVDVPSDIGVAEEILRSDPLQSDLYERTSTLTTAG
jgi:3-deoxy-manno-octulosonate cytidylyltransferase (CMP-KDO synthetase)